MNTLANELRRTIPGVEINENEPMAEHTSFRIGGPADVFIRCETETIPAVRSFFYKKGLPLLVLGNGTNVLVPDAGIRGAVLQTCTGKGTLIVEGNNVRADAGCLISRTSAFAAANGLSGLEYAQGIPGSVGGAVYMNAGAYGGDMAHSVSASIYCDQDGSVHELRGDEQCFGNRSSFYTAHPGTVVLSAEFSLTPDEPDAIHGRMAEYGAKRAASQPLTMPSAGSIFKRPVGYFAGKLIQDCGLKGCSIGGAQVSPKHAGFIVNTGNATADDVKRLIAHIQETVMSQFGVALECEVRILPEVLSPV